MIFFVKTIFGLSAFFICSFSLDAQVSTINFGALVDQSTKTGVFSQNVSMGGPIVDQEVRHLQGFSGYIFLHSINHPPTDIVSTSIEIKENLKLGTFIGRLSPVDLDTLNRIFFSSIKGTGDIDNELFLIKGDSLLANANFNFEEKSTRNIRLQVIDGRGGQFQKSFEIQVLDVNDAPIKKKDITDLASDEDQGLDLALSSDIFFDEDTDVLVYSIQGLNAPNLSFNSQTGSITGLPLQVDVGEYSLIITATDPSGELATAAFSLNINNVNDGPVVGAAQSDMSIDEDAVFEYTIPSETFTDEDGETLTLSLTGRPSSLSFDPATGKITGTPLQSDVGTYTIEVTAVDASNETVSDSFELTVVNVNDEPVIGAAQADMSIDEDAAFEYTIPSGTFTDEDGETLTLSLTGDLPSSLSFDPATGKITGTPLQSDVGTYTIEVTAVDASNETVSDSFELTVVNVNDEPVIGAAQADMSIDEDAAFDYTIPSGTFTDEDGETLTLSLTGDLPSSLSFEAGTGKITGTPVQSDVGTYTIEVTAVDASNETVSDSFELTVVNVNDAPVVVTSQSDMTIDEDEAFDYTIPSETFTDEDGEILTLSLTGDLPSSLSFEAGTGKITGTPVQADVDTYTIEVTATDAANETVSDSFELTVVNVNDAPVIGTTQADIIIDEDAAFEYTIPSGTFTDEDGETLTLSLTGDLPSSLSFEAGTGKITGTPVQSDVGTYTIEVIATDAANESVSDSFELTVVNVNDGPVIGAAQADMSIDEDAAFEYAIPSETFTDEDGETLTLSLTGDLPSSLSFEAGTGKITGTPVQSDVGTYTIEVTAVDAANETVSDSFELTVVNVNDEPVIGAAQADMSIDEDAAFEYTIPSETFTDEDGDVLTLLVMGRPSTLSFDPSTGKITGTPIQSDVGTHTIVVSAADPSDETVSDSFELTVVNVNDAPVVVAEQSDMAIDEDAAFDYTIPSETFTDEDGDVLTLLVMGRPSTLSFDPSTGKISGTPLQSDIGTHTIVVRATDSSDGTVSDSFELTIVNVNDAPVLVTEIPDEMTNTGELFSLMVDIANVTDEDGDAITVDASGMPPSLSIANGTISGTPSQSENGIFNITVTYADGNGGSVTDTFVLTVNLVTGIEESRDYGLVSVQPNPFTNEIKLTVEKGLFGRTDLALQLIGGTVVWNSSLALTGQTEIVLLINKPIAQGVYLLIVKPQNQRPIVRKVIKQQ